MVLVKDRDEKHQHIQDKYFIDDQRNKKLDSHKFHHAARLIGQQQEKVNLQDISHSNPRLYESITTLRKSKETQHTNTQKFTNNSHYRSVENHSKPHKRPESHLAPLTPHRSSSYQLNNENETLGKYLFQNGIISEQNINKEKLLSAVANYIYSVPTEDVLPYKKTIINLAVNLLPLKKRLNKNHKIGFKKAELVLHKWFYQNILGGSPAEYSVNEIAKQKNRDVYTIDKLHSLLLDKKNNFFSAPTFSEKDLKNTDRIWNDILLKEMPFLKTVNSEIKNTKVKNYNFISLYTGSLFLDKIGVNDFTSQDAIMAGEILWDSVDDSQESDKINIFQSPAKFFMAAHAPDWFNKYKDISKIGLRIIQEHKKYRAGISGISQEILKYYNDYNTAINNWLRKEKLAEKFISQCPSHELPYIPDRASIIRNKQQEQDIARDRAKELYLNGISKPCKKTPENLHNEYQKITTDIADNFYNIDRYLVSAALNGLPKEERQFISSISATIHHVNFNMRTVRPIIFGFFQGLTHNENINLKNTMLLAVINGSEERIYALHDKKDGHIEGYNIIRIDRDIRKYIENDLIDNKTISADYTVTDNMIKSKEEDVIYSIKRDVKIPDGDLQNDLVNYISKIHRDNYYNYIYESGNDKSKIQKAWAFMKNAIPFYQCIEGINNNAIDEYLPACLLDALSFIPTFGMAAKLSSKFSVSSAITFLKGKNNLLKGTLKLPNKKTFSGIVTPTPEDIKKIGKKLLKDSDPGFIPLANISNKLAKKLSKSTSHSDEMHNIIKQSISGSSTNKQTTPLPNHKDAASTHKKTTNKPSSHILPYCINQAGRIKRTPCKLDGKLNDNSILEQHGFSKPFYRADRRSYEELKMTNGFTPSEDFGAIPNMLKDTETLIVAEELTGLLRYISNNRANYHIYKIEGSAVRGASLTTNVEENPKGLAKLIGATPGENDTIDWLYETQGANALHEAHVKLADVTLDKITYLGKGSSKEFSDKIDALEPGDWRDYL